ncbi:Protein of unknown function DUF247 [Theobroma cacao]|nr:Protein of unknown function DUF247 [Theobroma cacao]
MAFEQCHYPKEPYICSYIVLLDYLVETDKDVDLLVKKNIFFNGMGSSAAVATMINNLRRGVASLSLCYDKMAKDLNDYYDNVWNHRWATLKNLMVFEQCHYPGEAYFCSYIQLLNYLIDADKDVDLLVEEGIFENETGSSAAVANMINNLSMGVADFSFCFDKI